MELIIANSAFHVALCRPNAKFIRARGDVLLSDLLVVRMSIFDPILQDLTSCARRHSMILNSLKAAL